MDNFESNKYRDELAKEIEQEPDKEKRKEILKTAKLSEGEEYQIARSLKHAEERPFFGEFSGGEVTQVGEYKEPSLEQKEKFNIRNERMAEIFENADFNWYLDGAVNISLYQDTQIRDHKDLDMSIFKEDLEKLEKLLSNQGFAIFLNYKEDNKQLMRRVTTKEISTLSKPDLSICKIYQNEKIQRGTPEPFNFVDLHVHDKDKKGDTIINYTGTTIPKKYFEPIKKELPDGKMINLSHPMVVAYHKLHSNRPYDLIDLQKLKPSLEEKDLAILREIMKNEIHGIENNIKEKLQELWGLLYPILELTHDKKIISEKIKTHPDIEKSQNNPKISDYVSFISEYISANPNTSFDGFLIQSLPMLSPREEMNNKLGVLN